MQMVVACIIGGISGIIFPMFHDNKFDVYSFLICIISVIIWDVIYLCFIDEPYTRWKKAKKKPRVENDKIEITIE